MATATVVLFSRVAHWLAEELFARGGRLQALRGTAAHAARDRVACAPVRTGK